ncbi:hypothetical protein Pedsa_0652 [Pseudopedobacter saltans DSM 12145]|uniref:Uncharacterized protein n=1 Tax=Pseudopedobacter saltans (strain ATCC 51119 / DSM 12145 / JCM 21818 / CCUG 39354 / LMG 10337 / NBRC 100064 / NCIMB 13643) TaxID=762903 RepID=F0S807_PSESL|nr:hypothetical protein Pedsa_0652 [Pseudopedobacter saltans DSM 12145]
MHKKMAKKPKKYLILFYNNQILFSNILEVKN